MYQLSILFDKNIYQTVRLHTYINIWGYGNNIPDILYGSAYAYHGARDTILAQKYVYYIKITNKTNKSKI